MRARRHAIAWAVGILTMAAAIGAEETRVVAVSAGDTTVAIEACDRLTERFELRRLEERSETLDALSGSAKTSHAAGALMIEAQATMDLAIQSGEFAAATQCAGLAEKAAMKARDLTTLAAIRKRKAEITTIMSSSEKFARLEESLQTKPDDPEANLLTGKYLCFVCGDWDKGLPRLAQGGDPALSALATESLKSPIEATSQAALANQWWEMAEKLDESERDAARLYARRWYGLAAGRLMGLAKSIAEKRLAEAAVGGSAKASSKRVDLIPLIDLKQDVERGEWEMNGGTLRCLKGGLVPKIGRENPTDRALPGAAQPNQKYRAAIQVRRNSVKLLVNDKPLASYEGDFAELKAIHWHESKVPNAITVFCADPTDFESIQVHEVSGPGKKRR